MTRFARDLPFGATVLDAERTRFRLWAPGQEEVGLILDGAEPQPMRRGEGGWFEHVAAAPPGTRYQFRLEKQGLSVPDPASRAQAGDVHDASLVVDPKAYAWRRPDWRGRPWEETVLYELHVGLLGGYRGVAERLPDLAALGVTAVQLMPINEFPGGRGWGYDGVLPYAPDSHYGTPDELKALIDRAHELDLMIFLDVVYNHFGPDGNYISLYAPGFFRDDLQTPWGGAVDFRRPEVRRYFTENVLYWLMEYRFDGLRFDAVHQIPNPEWLDEMAAEVRATVEPGRHVHLVLENEHNQASHLAGDINAQWNDDVHHAFHVILTGETKAYYAAFAERPAERLARSLKEGFIYQGEVFEAGDRHPRGTPSGHLPPTAFVSFLQNHDQVGNRAFGDRLITLCDEDALKAATAIFLLMPQIPMLFMGEEVGAREPFCFFTSHNEDLAVLVREGRRNEFKAFPEFSDAKTRERIPDPNAVATFESSRPSMAGQGGDPAWLDLYHRLLALRRDHVIPRLKGARAIDARALGESAVMGRWRMGDGTVLTIAANMGAEPAEAADLPRTEPFLAIGAEQARDGRLPPRTTLAWIES